MASDFGVATMTSTKISTGAVEPSVNVTVAGCSLLLATVVSTGVTNALLFTLLPVGSTKPAFGFTVCP